MYTLPTDRSTLWKPGIPGGIPNYYTIHASLPAGSTRATIQAAIDAAETAAAGDGIGRVVQLASGTYNINGFLNIFSRVVLRGAGPEKTRLVNTTANDMLINIGDNQYTKPLGWDINTANNFGTGLSSEGVKGDFFVNVSSSAGFTAGQVVFIDEITDPNRVWWSDNHPASDPTSRVWYSRYDRPICQMLKISRISGNTIYFTTPLHTNFQRAQQARLVGYESPIAYRAGIEDLWLSSGRDGNLQINGADECWVRNVQMDDSYNSCIGMASGLHMEFRDVYIRDANAWYNGGPGYGFDIRYGSSDCLIENCTSTRFNKVINMRAAGGGNVVAYSNFDDGAIYTAGLYGFVETGIQAAHYPCTHYTLFEGNWAFNGEGDHTEGNAIYITFFRNHLTGKRGNIIMGRNTSGLLVDNDSARAAGPMRNHWWYSFVGNVMGFQGMTGWKFEEPNPWTTSGYAIWFMGWNDINPYVPDPLVPQRMLRDGNFDYVTNTVQWRGIGGGIGSGTADTLPDSLYLTRKPGFFGSRRWPWVDATGTTKTYTLPARQRYEAFSGSAVTDQQWPAAMELISRTVPVTASGGTAAYAQNNDYTGNQLCQIAGFGGTVVYDLSSVAYEKRQYIYVALYWDGAVQRQLNIYDPDGAPQPIQMPTSYALEGATGSAGPWTTIVSASSVTNPARTHLIPFHGYTYLRFRSIQGGVGGSNISVKMDVYDGWRGVTDGIAIYGDSITADAFGDAFIFEQMPAHWYSKRINASSSLYFPTIVGGGKGFITGPDARDLIVSGTGQFATNMNGQILANSLKDVKYVGLCLGANDANGYNFGADEALNNYKVAYEQIIDAYTARGATVVLQSPASASSTGEGPNIPFFRGVQGVHAPNWTATVYALKDHVWNPAVGRMYRCAQAGTSTAAPTSLVSGSTNSFADAGGTARWSYVPSIRESRADLVSRGRVIAGPDMFQVFSGHPEWLRDGLHMNATGIQVWRDAWVTWALNTLYLPHSSGTAAPTLSITNASFANGMVGVAYSQTATAQDGISPYTWAVTSGALPTGLSISTTTGLISGIPSVVATSSFRLRVTDNTSATASKDFTIAIAAASPLTVSTTNLPHGRVNDAYSQTLQATGGSTPYSWSLTAGSLPTGLSLSGLGVISGTPSVSGTSSFTVRVSDALSTQASRSLQIIVDPAFSGAIDQSILPSQFRTIWDDVGIPGGIPTDTDSVRPASVWLPAGNPYGGYSVNPALTGTANAAAFATAMQAAIDQAGLSASASSRRIVFLKAGTYYVPNRTYTYSGSNYQGGLWVKVDNVTIRGEGANTTRIAANGTLQDYGGVIMFGHRVGTGDASFSLKSVASDALRGSTTITLNNVTNLQVGDVITIDKRDGAAVAVTGSPTGQTNYINGGYLWYWDGFYFKRWSAYQWMGPGHAGGLDPEGYWNTNGASQATANYIAQNMVPVERSVSQMNEITAINTGSNTITLKDPITIDFLSSSVSQVWRTIPATNSVGVGTKWVGLENIAVAGGNNLWGFPGGCVAMSYVAYGWVKNVEADGELVGGNTAKPGKYGYNIGIGRSYRVVVRDSYAHHSTDMAPGGQAYGIVVTAGSSKCLVENCISVWNNKPIALSTTGGGNVISYNYVDNAIINWNMDWQENAIDNCHSTFPHHDLIEGNWSPNIGGDTTHGNSGWFTHIRNYATGRNSGPGSSPGTNLRAVGLDGWTHDMAFIGNVLTVPGVSVYERTPFQQSGTPIYQLGHQYGGDSANWDNGYARDRCYRHGNWDSFSNAVVWNTGNLIQTIPESFYLTSKPSFFGPLTWPWVNPTGSVSTRVLTLPAKQRYDNGTPNIISTATTVGQTVSISGAIRANFMTYTTVSGLVDQLAGLLVNSPANYASIVFPVLIAGQTFSGTLVRVYNNDTGELLGSVTSNTGSGVWEITLARG